MTTHPARLISAVLLALLVACGRDNNPGITAASTSGANAIVVEVSPTSVTLAPGGTQQLVATVRTRNGNTIDKAPVTWTTTDPAVATVTEAGVVTAVAPGEAQVLAMFAVDTARADVTVATVTDDVLRNVILYSTEEFGIAELALVHPDGSGRTRLTTDARGYFGPDISPDGRQIAFVSFGTIYVMKSDGTGIRPVVSADFPAAPVWSPDGSRIAFGANVQGPFGDVGRIFVVNVDGSGLRQLSPDVPDPNQFYYFDAGPTWSPDGSKVAFSRLGVLTVINVDGSGMTTLSTPEGAEYPSWSPDGSRIAYSSFISTRDIFVSNADGSNPVRVTSAPEQENNPRWSPDSRRLVFCRVVNGFFQLFIIDADGTGETRLSANPNTHECPAVWSPVP